MIVPRALVQPEQFASAVSEAERMLGSGVVRVRYKLGNDWTGDPAVFFRVLLSDAASPRDQLRKVASHVETEIVRQVEPLEQWGVYPYFNYRSQSEQAEMNEPAWA